MPVKKPKKKKPKKTTTKKAARGAKHSIAKATLAISRKKSGNRFPLAIAEKRLKNLFGYVKKRGGSLPG